MNNTKNIKTVKNVKKSHKLKQIIKQGELKVLKVKDGLYRVGYCVKCGGCCKGINMRTSINEEIADWVRLHGIKVTMLDNKSAILSWIKDCKYLQIESFELDGTYSHTCQNYKSRPNICVNYPMSPSSHKECMFVFINTRELDWFNKQIKEPQNET